VRCGTHLVPVQPAQACPQRRDRDGANAIGTDDIDQIGKARLDILDAALATPVALGWEVDDEARQGELPRIKNEHAARLHGFALASSFVSLEVFGVNILEL
jgi:hypothetical protein